MNDTQKNTLSYALLVQVEPDSKMSLLLQQKSGRKMKQKTDEEEEEVRRSGVSAWKLVFHKMLNNVNIKEKRKVNGEEKAKIK